MNVVLEIIPERVRRPSAMKQRYASLIGVAAVAVLFACRDYQHTNPFDVLTPTSDVTVAGPDTLFTIGEVAKFSTESTRGTFTDPTALWRSSNLDDLNGDYTGAFVLFKAPLYPLTETASVTASIGHFVNAAGQSAWTRSFSKDVVLTQRLVRVQLRCPDAHACDTLTAGDVRTVWIDGFDSGANQVVGFEDPATNPAKGAPIAAVVSRDPTVAAAAPVGVRAANVTALRSGTTWIVATRVALLDTLRDSLQVVVR